MKKFLLILFILLDLTAIAGASVYLYAYVMHKKTGTPMRTFGIPQPRALRPSTSVPVVAASSAAAPTPLSAPAAIPAAVPAAGATTAYRNIGFRYTNLKAKQVLIRADFTGWKGVPMKREPNGVWEFAAQLTPGEYAYCFTVDDKIIKDPANKHTKRIAQTLVSAITVEKAPSKP